MKINTLRSFITLAVSATVAAALFCAATLFYTKSADTLKDNYSKDITRQLNQINNQVEDQIDIIDSVYPLFMSNNLIREYLDPASSVYTSKSPVEKRLEIERQMSYLLISTYLWDEKFVNSVYIFDMNGGYSKVSLYENNSELDQVKTIYDQVSKEGASLQIKTLNSDNHSIYFSRNVNSMYTGSQIGTIILDISQDAWKQSYSRNTDENWLICIFNKDMQVLSHAQSSNTAVFQGLMEQASTGGSPFREIKLDKTSYFMASQQLGTSGITSAVAVPKPYLLKDLNQTLRSFLFIFLIIISFLSVFPLLWMISAATNTSLDVARGKIMFGTYAMQNFKNLIASQNLAGAMGNSFLYAIVQTVISMFVCSLAGFGFELYHDKNKDRLFSILLLAMMVPQVATMVPLFKMMSRAGLLNSVWAFILPSISTPFLIMMFRQNSRNFPNDLMQAARIDGLSETGIFFRMYVPIMKSTYAAAAVITFMNAWNAYLWPKVVMTDNRAQTMPMLIANIASGYSIDYGMLMMGVLFCSIPTMIVFFVLQKQFAEGITGAVK